MVSLQELEAQYRTLLSRMEQSEAAMAGQDLEAVEVCADGAEQVVAALARLSAQLQGRRIAAGEESAWGCLTDVMRQALVRAERNREHIQNWIAQTQEALSHLSRGGRAVNGYAESGTPDSAEFLSARG
jgi:hypothetical protein